MKTIGIIGGLGPESTIEYYRAMVAEYMERKPDGSYPSIIINSIDLKKVLDLAAANERDRLTDYLLTELQKLARAGAGCGLIAANTPHIVFNEVRSRSPIPLISIVEITRDAANERGLRRLALFATSFTVKARFYPDVFSKASIALSIPDEKDQAFIHHIYLNELVKGMVREETRAALLTILDRLKERDGIQGLILGGTELSLIFREPIVRGIVILDTTKIHARAIVAEALS
jgi:aspartate racemase